MKRTLVVVGVLLAAVLLLLVFDTPPPPDSAYARLDRPPHYEGFDTYLWRPGTDGDPEALTNRYRYWRLTVKLGSNAADSVEVKIRDVDSGTWKTLSYLGAVPLAAVFDVVFLGPEIDSVEVFTGTAAWCRLDGFH